METTQQEINVSNLMTAQDYAKLMGVTRKTVYNWIDTNKIQQVNFLGKNWVDTSTHVKSSLTNSDLPTNDQEGR